MTPILLASFLIVLLTNYSVYAGCDNHCSGHGTCMTDDVCSCYDGWGIGLSHDSGDCSDRICPYDIAWVDTPSSSGKFHKYAECSGKGICDRSSGNCMCFDGFEGNACQRSACPSGCSGHGTCEYIQDFGYGQTWNDYTSGGFSDDTKKFAYHIWDKSKARACVCDALYNDVDCSKRMCPYGTDVLAVNNNLLIGEKYQTQTITFVAAIEGSSAGAASILQGSTFALTFKSKMNETFTTIPIVFDKTDMTGMARKIKLALLNLPNRVIDDISVVVKTVAQTQTISALGLQSSSSSTIYPVTIELMFSGDSVQGVQNPIVVENYACANGCTPKITGLSLNTRINYGVRSNYEDNVPSQFYTSFECGRRGKCDYSTGVCNCFSGYTGENCNTQHALF